MCGISRYFLLKTCWNLGSKSWSPSLKTQEEKELGMMGMGMDMGGESFLDCLLPWVRLIFEKKTQTQNQDFVFVVFYLMRSLYSTLLYFMFMKIDTPIYLFSRSVVISFVYPGWLFSKMFRQDKTLLLLWFQGNFINQSINHQCNACNKVIDYCVCECFVFLHAYEVFDKMIEWVKCFFI